jgi:hypothetical protein
MVLITIVFMGFINQLSYLGGGPHCEILPLKKHNSDSSQMFKHGEIPRYMVRPSSSLQFVHLAGTWNELDDSR